ncbi:MAG: DUF6483 family protein [Treponema sp.]|jgi:hypothetical protein|nr:DUF6483 family protein [Treponema sp.]
MFRNDYPGPNYGFQGNTGHDYILRVIEQFAAYLWAIVFNKKAQNYDIAIEKIEEAYNELLYRKGNDLKDLSAVEIIEINSNGNLIEKENIEIIANLLYEEAEITELRNGPNNLSLEYYCKSLKLFLLLMNKMDTQKFIKNIDEIIYKLEGYEIDDDTKIELYKYYYKSGLFGKAEDMLYQLLENNYPEIINEIVNFYELLIKKDDTELEHGNLPRDEITDAMEKLRNINYS